MKVTIATKIAKLSSRRTIDRWCDNHPELARRIGKHLHIDETKFFELITNGTNLLDWEQAKIYAASLVGEHYLGTNLGFTIELENLIPGDAEWIRAGGGYWSSPCVDWRKVAQLCRRHQASADDAQRKHERAKRGIFA